MSNHTHETASTQFVEADGIRYAYRRFGKVGKVPLLFLGYFNSNMDAWDPAVTNTEVEAELVHRRKNDRTVPPDLERLAAKRMDAKVTEVASSHVPMLSHRDVVINVIRAGAKAVREATAAA